MRDQSLLIGNCVRKFEVPKMIYEEAKKKSMKIYEEGRKKYVQS